MMTANGALPVVLLIPMGAKRERGRINHQFPGRQKLKFME